MGAWLSSTLQKIRFLNPTQQETFQNLGYVSAIIENIQDLLLNPPCYVYFILQIFRCIQKVGNFCPR